MNTGSTVGANVAPSIIVGDNTLNYFNNAGSTPAVALADIEADLIAAGAVASDGTALAAGNFTVTEIDILLKPTGGHVNIGGTQETTTSADATVTNNGTADDVDPGGAIHDQIPQADYSIALADGTGIRLVVDYVLV